MTGLYSLAKGKRSTPPLVSEDGTMLLLLRMKTCAQNFENVFFFLIIITLMFQMREWIDILARHGFHRK